MRRILRKIACVMAMVLSCSAGTLPSCAFMGGGGGGMKGGMLSERHPVPTQEFSA